MGDYEIYESLQAGESYERLWEEHSLPKENEEKWIYLRDRNTLETFRAKVVVSKNPSDTEGWDKLWIRKQGVRTPILWGYVKILEREEEEEVVPTKGTKEFIKMKPVEGDLLRSMLEEE